MPGFGTTPSRAHRSSRLASANSRHREALANAHQKLVHQAGPRATNATERNVKEFRDGRREVGRLDRDELGAAQSGGVARRVVSQPRLLLQHTLSLTKVAFIADDTKPGMGRVERDPGVLLVGVLKRVRGFHVASFV